MFKSNALKILIAAMVVFASSTLNHAQNISAYGSGSSKAYLALNDVKEGMRGTAMTVFNGTEAEPFDVEIIGVVPGAIGPKQDLIIGRISGGKAERTGVFAGMSGSPVFVNGKLIGAISYSFPFSKEPMCGITPIEQMISIFEHQPRPTAVSEPRVLSFGEMASTDWMPDYRRGAIVDSILAGSGSSMMASVAGQAFRPIGTPVTFNGISQKVLDMYAPHLMQAGLVPVAAAGGSAAIGPMKSADPTTLIGGDSVAMQLSRGDFSMAASGTVTLRDGDRIYAFGHPFLSLGSSELPMSESSVVTVVPNVNNSFKLAVPTAMVGTMTQDRATGVYGKLGQAPKMIPVTITMETSRGRKETFQFEIVKDGFLTPLLVNMGIANVLVAQERMLGDSLIGISGTMAVKDAGKIRIDRRFSGAQATGMAAGSMAGPVAVLFRSGFEGFDIDSIHVDLTSQDGSRIASLDRIAVDRATVKAGEAVEVQAYASTNTGKHLMQRIQIQIPRDTPAGSFSIMVGDGNAVQQASSTKEFVPRTLSELVRTFNQIKFPDRLYAQLFRTSAGAIVGANEMPGLPPSVLATLNNERATGGIKPAVRSVVSEIAVAPSEFIISGSQTLTIEVIK